MTAKTSHHHATSTQARRMVRLAVLAVVVAALSTVAAHVLHLLIAFFTQVAFFGRFSTEWVAPDQHTRGFCVVFIPAIGGGIIALMARYGSRAICGHGIPEVMQQVLANRSRISPKVAWMKPLSSAISIGTGGPYGAEGPVIATGSSIGSLVGQVLSVTASERKTLLAAGAAAAMTAIFGSPVAATLLAVELLLFEWRARSVVPVAIAAVCAQALRFAIGENAALFSLAPSTSLHAPASALLGFVIIGAGAGLLAVTANAAVHKTESLFEHLPVHWMWCPVIGGLFVGLAGWYEPRIFGPGYTVISDLLAGNLPVAVITVVCGLKWLVWTVSLSSGTSGGTLAPMLIIGGGFGALVARAGGGWLPMDGISPGLAALVGMIAFFAGGSRAFFASIVLGVEITQQADVLWPLATASTAALGVAYLLSPRSIMSSPVEQRGVRVPMDFDTDLFAHVSVGQVMETTPQTIRADITVASLADQIAVSDPLVSRHTALLVVDNNDRLAGVITRQDLLNAIEHGLSDQSIDTVLGKPPVVAHPDEPLQLVIERMHIHGVGRLPVVERTNPTRLVGYLGRAAILSAHRFRWRENHEIEPGLFVPKPPLTS